MADLTTKQKQYLRGLAHGFEPVVRVGRGGITAAVVAEADRSLESHELIKVRIDHDESPVRKDLAQRLADETGSGLAGTIGKIAILYRARKEKPKIKLP